MKFRWVVPVLLTVSLLLNAAMIGYLAKIGKIRQMLVRVDLVEHNPPRMDLQTMQEEWFRKYPNTSQEIVFAGDSMIHDGPWAEMLSEVHNRGIGGDTVGGVIGRIGEITEGKPRHVFLLLGANDLSMAVPEAQIVRHYRTLLERIRKESPETVTTVIGTLPVNPTFPAPPIYSNAQVISLNTKLKELVEKEFPGFQFLDLRSLLIDDTGNLRRELSIDGLHLNIDAYLKILKPIEECLKRSPAPKTPVG